MYDNHYKEVVILAIIYSLFLVLALCVVARATTLFPHQETNLMGVQESTGAVKASIQREFQEVYAEIKSPKISTGTAQVMTIGKLTVSTMNFSIATVDVETVNVSTITTAFISTATITNLHGSTSGNNACATCIGYSVSTTVVLGSAVASTGSTQWFDVASFQLTPGCWNLTGQVSLTLNGAIIANGQYGGIGTLNGSNADGLVAGDTYLTMFNPTSAADPFVTVSNVIKCTASSATYYLKAQTAFSSGGPPKAYGRMTAIRLY